MTINSTLSTDREKVFYSLALFNKEGTEYSTGTSIFPYKKKSKKCSCSIITKSVSILRDQFYFEKGIFNKF